jgi:hypothetical protein
MIEYRTPRNPMKTAGFMDDEPDKIKYPPRHNINTIIVVIKKSVEGHAKE